MSIRAVPAAVRSPIPWASPAAQYRTRQKTIQAAIERVLDSGAFVLGEEVEAFEHAFAQYCGAGHGIGVASGTDALELAMRAFGIGPGDEVITVSHTAVATAAAVLACGATPVLVDIDQAFYTIDSAKIEVAITPRTKAIVPVHLYGQAADINPILALGRARKLRVIEDCAQATGGCYGSRRLGSMGDAGCFSFYPTKNLGAIGDGGMVITSDAEIAARLRRLRQYGWDEMRKTREVGRNSRLDPMQAAILAAKLPHLDADNARRAAIAARYNRGLAGLPLVLPAARTGATHVYHLYVMRCDDRGRLMADLRADQIGSAVHYAEPVHLQRGYAEKCVLPKGGLPLTETVVGKILSLPMYPELTDAEVDRVIALLRLFCCNREI
ncbi:MAG TPA: DegT/DnrJ/EryC1/StrS family aminotransferase [Xanthobacteraceae bacterium]|jgi:dTDP-4-amino-4,6-dideoxygalactose transaminase|nr:DegT/DnrJ/EryC1/StrS family aminotransferase [Xanthobacteraceae bacterium]